MVPKLFIPELHSARDEAVCYPPECRGTQRFVFKCDFIFLSDLAWGFTMP